MVSHFSLDSTLMTLRSFCVIPKMMIQDEGEPDANRTGLDEAAITERDYVRKRLRDELKREPSEEEVDEWLRQHTEGY